MRAWLTDDGSLTARLKARCAGFGVKNLHSSLGNVNPDEHALFGLRAGPQGYVREVFLMCAGRPAIFAHSIVPVHALRRAWRGLRRQGAKPLGETLWADREITRHPLSFRCLSAPHPLYRRLASHLPEVPGSLWARRSLFLRGSAPLWVTEVFLPPVFEL